MKLKPCPFCGGEAQVNERYRGGTANRKMYWISCSACGVSQQHDNTSGYRYQSKAIDRWNRREPIDRIVEKLEAEMARDKKFWERDSDESCRGGYTAFEDAIEIVKSGGKV